MTPTTHPAADISPGMTRLLALAAGVIVASLYYAQTLVGPISRETGLSLDAAGLIVTLTQVGYALGLLFIVPLGDLLENRKLVFVLLLATSVMLALAAFSSSAWLFLATSLGIGLGSVAAQVLVPFAAHLSREATRGQTVGKVVSGLLLGIMLARPAASLIADHFSWHAVYGGAALAVFGLAFVLRARLPQRAPSSSLPYGAPDRFDVDLVDDDPGTAPARRLPCGHVRFLQPVLDGDAADAGRPRLPFVADRHRDFRPGRHQRGGRLALRRAPGRPRAHPVRHRRRPAAGRGRLRAAAGRARLARRLPSDCWRLPRSCSTWASRPTWCSASAPSSPSAPKCAAA